MAGHYWSIVAAEGFSPDESFDCIGFQQITSMRLDIIPAWMGSLGLGEMHMGLLDRFSSWLDSRSILLLIVMLYNDYQTVLHVSIGKHPCAMHWNRLRIGDIQSKFESISTSHSSINNDCFKVSASLSELKKCLQIRSCSSVALGISRFKDAIWAHYTFSTCQGSATLREMRVSALNYGFE